MTTEPVSVALKFGFLAVMYLFMLWVARSALKDMRRSGARAGTAHEDATGFHSASAGLRGDSRAHEARLIVERAPGHEAGMIYDLDGGAVLGRGAQADIRLEDPFASSAHARVFGQGGIMVLEDLGSTNGTYLNEELLEGPMPLHPGDRLRIGESEFTFESD